MEEQQKQYDAAEEAPVLSEVQVATAQREMATMLQPGETVTKTLKRLGATTAQAHKGTTFTLLWDSNFSLIRHCTFNMCYM